MATKKQSTPSSSIPGIAPSASSAPPQSREYVYATGTAHGKRVQALGGAKNHMIVMPDADLDQAVDALVGAAYGSAGERCMAISVAVAVGNQTADELIATLKPRIAALCSRARHGTGRRTGPAGHRRSPRPRQGLHHAGRGEGAELSSMAATRNVADGEGFFLGASLFDHVKPAMRIYQEEIFGPVLGIVRATDFADRASTSSTSTSSATAPRSSPATETPPAPSPTQVQAGMVGINVPIPCPWPSTASAAGSGHYSATMPSMVRRASASTPA